MTNHSNGWLTNKPDTEWVADDESLTSVSDLLVDWDWVTRSSSISINSMGMISTIVISRNTSNSSVSMMTLNATMTVDLLLQHTSYL